MKNIRTYCPKCGKETTHIIYIEDGYGASGVSRIFTTLISFGMCNLVITKYSTCCSCGHTKEL